MIASSGNKHTLIIVNPGHFHAGLTLRQRHPLLSDEVYVYAEDGSDLDDFLRLVTSFNQRQSEPTSWGLHIYRGPDYLQALLHEPPGDVAIVAGKNNTKMSTMRRLQEAGIHVLGDKTWVVDASQLHLLKEIAESQPLVMDIMTEHFEVATRLQRALSADDKVFGEFRDMGSEPAVYIRSVHHLYKLVNGRPLVRPAWYFDTAVQGEGITDVTTHLVDLAQQMINGNSGLDEEGVATLTAARQWSTGIPLEVFSRITGLENYPADLSGHVREGTLQYLCNANIRYLLRGVSVEIDSIWDLAIPKGGGDTHYCVLRGAHADLVVDQGPETGFVTRLRVIPTDTGYAVEQALASVLTGLGSSFPGVGYEATGNGYVVTIPAAMHQGHEARFSEVLDQFLGYVDAGTWPRNVSEKLLSKYSLLAKAYDLSHR